MSGRPITIRLRNRLGLLLNPALCQICGIPVAADHFLCEHCLHDLERVPNPAHKRSPHLRLTEAGRRYVEEMDAREQALGRGLGRELDPRDLETAAATLRRVRAFFEGEAYQARIAAAPPTVAAPGADA